MPRLDKIRGTKRLLCNKVNPLSKIYIENNPKKSRTSKNLFKNKIKPHIIIDDISNAYANIKNNQIIELSKKLNLFV